MTLVPSTAVSEVEKFLGTYDCTVGTLEEYKFSNFVCTLDGCSNTDGSEDDDEDNNRVSPTKLDPEKTF